MSVPVLPNVYTPTLGASITNVGTSLTLSADSGDNGHVWLIIGTEGIDGDKSGTSVTGLNRASFKVNGVASAASHNQGDTVYFVSVFEALKGCFPTKIDEQNPAAAASMSFSSISGSFQHLQILYSVRSDNAVNNNDLYIQLNGDTTAIYDSERQVTSAASITAAEFLAQTQMVIGYSPGTSATANYFARGNIWIPDYTSTVRDKVAICESTLKIGNATTQVYKLSATGTWRTTSAAITSILMKGGAGNITGKFTLIGWP